jgi:hypothetical protein
LVPVAPGPIITRLAAWPVLDTEMTVVWTTDKPSKGQVLIGTDPNNMSLSSAPDSAAMSQYHVVKVSGLTRGTRYYYAAIATDPTGASSQSATVSATTTTILGAAGTH